MFDSTALMNQRSDIKVINKNIELNALQRESELTKLKPEFGIKYDHMMGWSNQHLAFFSNGNGEIYRLPGGHLK
jgi:hypothetical protein